MNFYIKEIYGIPQETVDAWETSLGVLVSNGVPEVFNHPVIEKVRVRS